MKFRRGRACFLVAVAALLLAAANVDRPSARPTEPPESKRPTASHDCVPLGCLPAGDSTRWTQFIGADIGAVFSSAPR